MSSIIENLKNAFTEQLSPSISLRSGNAIDSYEIVIPVFDPEIDCITSKYLETYFWGLAHLDSQSWLYYLPHFLIHALENIANPNSNVTEAFLSSLRPPDRVPTRFEALTTMQKKLIIEVLEKLAFSEESVWQEPAMLALEEYWAPDAIFK